TIRRHCLILLKNRSSYEPGRDGDEADGECAGEPEVAWVEQLAPRPTRRRLDSELDRLREYHCMFTTVTTNSARQCQGLRMWRSAWRNSRRRPPMAPSI